VRSRQELVGDLVSWNNSLVRAHASDRDAPNPRPLEGVTWNAALEAAYPVLRAEWDAFADAGGRLPRMEELIDEHQGNEGAWHAGLLISRGRVVPGLADRFPQTVAALDQIPHLWSALFSVLDPGAQLHEHVGPNAGMLRYHLGIDCGADAALVVRGETVPYRDGVGILFDDTEPHAAWNHGPAPRVTLFCEAIRPVDGAARFANAAVQRILALDPRFRRAPVRAAEWERTLNSSLG